MKTFVLALIGVLVFFDLVLLYACFKNDKEIEDEEHRRKDK